MSKTTKIYIAFLLIFLVGFFLIYIYIKLFLDQQLTSVDAELVSPISVALDSLQ
jgi:hypothetical protein